MARASAKSPTGRQNALLTLRNEPASHKATFLVFHWRAGGDWGLIGAYSTLWSGWSFWRLKSRLGASGHKSRLCGFHKCG